MDEKVYTETEVKSIIEYLREVSGLSNVESLNDTINNLIEEGLFYDE